MATISSGVSPGADLHEGNRARKRSCFEAWSKIILICSWDSVQASLIWSIPSLSKRFKSSWVQSSPSGEALSATRTPPTWVSANAIEGFSVGTFVGKLVKQGSVCNILRPAFVVHSGRMEAFSASSSAVRFLMVWIRLMPLTITPSSSSVQSVIEFFFELVQCNEGSESTAWRESDVAESTMAPSWVALANWPTATVKLPEASQNCPQRATEFLHWAERQRFWLAFQKPYRPDTSFPSP